MNMENLNKRLANILKNQEKINADIEAVGEDREDEKMFIIPLPELVTTDGKQQYLTYKDYKYFASRRNETLRQTWKEEHLKFVPKIYRQFAVEFDDAWEREVLEDK